MHDIRCIDEDYDVKLFDGAVDFRKSASYLLWYIAIAIIVGTLMVEHLLSTLLKTVNQKRTDAGTQTQRREHLETFTMRGNPTSRTLSTTTRPESLVVTRSGKWSRT